MPNNYCREFYLHLLRDYVPYDTCFGQPCFYWAWRKSESLSDIRDMCLGADEFYEQYAVKR